MSDIFLGEIQFFAENPDHLLGIFDLIMYDGDGAYRLIVRQHLTVTVQYPPSRSFDAPLSFMEIRRQLRIVVRTPDHKVYQPAEQKEQQYAASQKDYKHLLSVKYLIIIG